MTSLSEFIKRFQTLLQEHRWVVFTGLLAIFAYIGGVVGYYRTIEDYGIFNSAYSAFRLFTLNWDGPADHSKITPELQLVKFLAPIATVLSVIKTLQTAFNQQWQMLKASFRGGHYVICGMDNGALMLANDILARGKRVAIIVNDTSKADIESLKEKGAVVIQGSMLDKHNLQKAGVTRCSVVIFMSADDIANIGAFISVSGLIKGRQSRQNSSLKSFIHLSDRRLEKIIETAVKGIPYMDHRLFNIYENSAKLLFTDHPLYENVDILNADSKPVRLLIIGFGHIGEQVLLQAVLLGHFPNGKKIKITVVDNDAARKEKDFLLRYPQIKETCNDLCFKNADASSEDFYQKFLSANDYTFQVICFKNDTLSISTAIKMTDACKLPVVPREKMETLVAVRIPKAHNVGDLLDDDKDRFKNIFCFGAIEKVSGFDVVIDERLDEMAKINHFIYSKIYELIALKDEKIDIKNLAKEIIPNILPSLSNDIESKIDSLWHKPDNSAFLKESNRSQAMHMDVKLHAVGLCALLKEKAGENEKITEEEAQDMLIGRLEELSKVEHERWMAFHYKNGWTLLEADFLNKNDPESKRHTCLVSWEDLDRVNEVRRRIDGKEHFDFKIYDMAHVVSIPYVLKSAGYVICRKKMEV